MSKKITILTLFVILSLSKGFSQNIDSLKTALQNAKHDTIRCYVLLEIANEYYLENPAKAIEYCEQAKTISEKSNFLKGKAESYGWLGYLYNNQGDITKALDYYHKSLKIREEINDKQGIAVSFNSIGIIYRNQGDIAKALEYFHRSLKIYEELNDKQGIAGSLSNIGVIYRNQGDIAKALEYYYKSLKIDEELNDKKGIAASLNNIGIIYRNQGDIAKALEYFHKSLKIDEELNDKQGIGTSLNNIGSIYYDQGDIAKALDYFQKSLKIREEINDKRGIAISLNSIAKAMLQQGRVTGALDYAKRSMDLAHELGYPKLLKRAASTLKEIYQKQNKYKEAFEMYELEIVMRDSIDNEETQKASIQKQFQYQYEKKAAADSVVNAKQHEIKNIEIKKQQAEIKAKRNQQYALYGGLSMVVLFAGFVYNRLKITRKQKLIIEETNEELNQTNEEILAQRDQIERQKHKIEHAHNEVKASINYAERIQKALLDNKEHWDSISEHFILFRPRDVVSGDFYWAYSFQGHTPDPSQEGNIVIWAAADCTGHGVPGAFMSMLGVSFLNEIVVEGGETNPGKILDKLRSKIIKTLEQKSSDDERKDGMDIALCVWNKSTNILQYAGANNPLVIIRGDEMIEQKADKMPIGKYVNDLKPFTTHEIQLQKGDTVYTFTDGFQDQFGGAEGKKYMVKRMKNYLSGMNEVPLSRQKELLNEEFVQWMEVGDMEQIDDVCVIGIKI